jgi:hypothetical protein
MRNRACARHLGRAVGTHRGLLTFGMAGMGLFVLASLIAHNDHFPKRLGTLGNVLAVLLVIIYLGRLIILSPTNPVVAVLVVVTGFIVNPAWYIWLGLALGWCPLLRASQLARRLDADAPPRGYRGRGSLCRLRII